jgi:hypothetical protein
MSFLLKIIYQVGELAIKKHSTDRTSATTDAIGKCWLDLALPALHSAQISVVLY